MIALLVSGGFNEINVVYMLVIHEFAQTFVQLRLSIHRLDSLGNIDCPNTLSRLRRARDNVNRPEK